MKIKPFFSGDRKAITITAVVIVAALLLFPLLSPEEQHDKENPSASSMRKGSPVFFAQPDTGHGDGSVADEEQPPGELFPFNPNTADSTQLLRLGLKPWQVRSIYKYRAKGGRYRKPTDFARLYGLTLHQYKRLEPYIRIPQEPMARDVITDAPPRQHLPSYGEGPGRGSSTTSPVLRSSASELHPSPTTPDKLPYGTTLDINTADTTHLKRIPAIGSYFARRIIELRNRRKFFTSPDELLVIRNFPETALAYMRVSTNFSPIHINTMTQKELQHHPLLSYLQARDIINLRRTMGTIHSAQDMSALPSFTAEELKRIAPYLRFE